MSKSDVFSKEYQYIEKEKYRENAKILVELLPDYFFEVPAASTGKYHPKFASGEGGLLRHTKAALRIAYEMYKDESITGIFNSDEKDLMIVGLMLHDGLKSGLEKSQYTLFDHPLLVCDYIRKNQAKTSFTDGEINFITNVIESHMGPWNTSSYSDVVLPKPKNKYQKFVHMCDFLASRKFLNVNFENNDIIE